MMLGGESPPAPLDTLEIPVIPTLIGTSDFISEELWAFEIGYRFRSSPAINFDGSVFYNRYDNLLSIEQGEAALFPEYIQVPFYMLRNGRAEISGIEVSGDYLVNKRMRLKAAYTYWYFDYNSPGDIRSKGNSPSHQVLTGLSWDPGSCLNFNFEGRYIGRLANEDGADYFGLDAHLGWSPLKYLEFNLVGQNLLESEHFEFYNEFDFLSAYIERSVYVSMAWRF